jgi:hypothetical protein
VPALAQTPQTPRQAAEKMFERKVPAGSMQACSLITRADIEKVGLKTYSDPEPYGQGGWICDIGAGQLIVHSGPKSWEDWESTLKNFKKDKEPRTPAPAFGERAYFLYPKPDNKYQDTGEFLVAKKGNHTVALSLNAAEGKPADSVRPALESLMKVVLARLP